MRSEDQLSPDNKLLLLCELISTAEGILEGESQKETDVSLPIGDDVSEYVLASEVVLHFKNLDQYKDKSFSKRNKNHLRQIIALLLSLLNTSTL